MHKFAYSSGESDDGYYEQIDQEFSYHQMINLVKSSVTSYMNYDIEHLDTTQADVRFIMANLPDTILNKVLDMQHKTEDALEFIFEEEASQY